MSETREQLINRMEEINEELVKIKDEMKALATKDNVNFIDKASADLLMIRMMLLSQESKEIFVRLLSD